MENAHREVEIGVEYLDAKRHPRDNLFEEMAALLAAKGWGPDVVVSMDDDALHFLFRYGETLYPGVPVVFGGLNVEEFNGKILDDRSGYTGVVERLDLESTIRTILHIQPETRRIVFVHDRTTSGLADRATIEGFADAYDVRFLFPDGGAGLTEGQLLAGLATLDRDSAVYFLGFFRDSNDESLSAEYIIPLICDTSPVPVYSHADSYMGLGIVGGKLLSGDVHGRSIARVAMQVLDGRPVDEIPVSVESSNRFMFDYRVLSRFGIAESRLPEPREVLYAPESIFERHRRAILTGAAGLVVLVAVTLVLLILVVRIHRAERRLMRSEATYRAMFEENRAMKLVIDPTDGKILEANPSARSYYGHEVLVGRRVTDLDTGEDVLPAFRRAAAGATDRLERRHRLASGSIRAVELYPSVIFGGENPLLYTIIHDVTDQKDAHAKLAAALENKETLMAELNHRIKNNLAIVSSLIDMKSSELHDPQDLSDLSHRIDAIRLVHEKLYETGDVRFVNLDTYLQDVVMTVISSFADSPVETVYDLPAIRCPAKTAVTVGLIVNELATNSVKHAFPYTEDPRFELRATHHEGTCSLEVSNSGPPLDAEFSIDSSGSLGMRLIRGLVRQLNGELIVTRTPHPAFTVRFPFEGVD